MKLYREGKNELRIHLTKEDLEHFSITLDDFDYDNTRGRKVIWELFDKAREETGFDASKEKVYIQLYPMEKGGCELFVTGIETEEKSKDCFLFSRFEDLFSAMQLFPSLPQKSALYRMKEKEGFLFLIPSEEVPPALLEFGEKVKAPSLLFLKSRCQKINWSRKNETHKLANT